MRSVLFAMAIVLCSGVAQAQRPNHFWLYRNPQTGANGWGYSTPGQTLQFGTSARQDRVYNLSPYYQPYPVYAPSPYYGGFNQNPWYGGFGAAY